MVASVACFFFFFIVTVSPRAISLICAAVFFSHAFDVKQNISTTLVSRLTLLPAVVVVT